MDRIGNQTCNILFTSLIAIGQAIFLLGMSIQSYSVSLIGRLIFGLGGENLNVSQFNVILGWFSNYELSMALSLTVTVNRLSTALNDNITPGIVSYTNLPFGVLIGTVFCMISVICAIILNSLDKKKTVY